MTEKVKTTQNSPIRRLNPFIPFARWLVDKGVSANQITAFGKYSVMAGAALKAIPQDIIPSDTISAISLGFIGGGELVDAVDGPAARYAGTDSNQGALNDFKSDRQQELAMAISRIISASYRKDVLGVIAAMASGMTSPLPSFLRAQVESVGMTVPESGKNLASLLGTRFARAIMGAATTSYPVLDGNTIQPIVDAFSATANILTTIERFKIYQEALRGKLEKELNPDKIEQGKMKVNELKKFIPISYLAIGVIGVMAIMNSVNS